MEDLREGLEAKDIYDGRDKRSFECLAIHLLRLNRKSTREVKISDVLDTLFPQQRTVNQVRRRSTLKKSQDQAVKRQPTNSKQAH